ncbi:MAG: hypothetical protein MI865_11130 [Proteobacteria bacterium]|nr:hypothetical protein [Pseudomonadota bacterium]
MKHMKPVRLITSLIMLISASLISTQALARVSIHFNTGHYGHGYKYGYGHYKHYKHYKHYGRYGHRSYYKKRHYYPRYYRYHYYPKHYGYYSYPYKYKRYNYYRPYNYSYKYRNYTPWYSLRKDSSNYINSKKQNYAYSNKGDAWTTLINGYSRDALGQFGNEAQKYPNAGLPKAGFALAAASSGNLDKGIRAMRRAFQYDPNSLHQLSKDSRLQQTLDKLIAKYEYPLQHKGNHADEAFMVAALNYLKGDYAAAKQAVAIAKKYNDNSQSFQNLQHLLNTGKSNYYSNKY